MDVKWEWVLTGVIIILVAAALQPYAQKALASTGMWEGLDD